MDIFSPAAQQTLGWTCDLVTALTGEIRRHLDRMPSRQRDPSPTRGQFSSGWVPRASMAPASNITADSMLQRPSTALKRRSVSADQEGLQRMAEDARTSGPGSRPSAPARWLSLGRLSSVARHEDGGGQDEADGKEQVMASPLSGITRFESMDFGAITLDNPEGQALKPASGGSSPAGNGALAGSEAGSSGRADSSVLGSSVEQQAPADTRAHAGAAQDPAVHQEVLQNGVSNPTGTYALGSPEAEHTPPAYSRDVDSGYQQQQRGLS